MSTSNVTHVTELFTGNSIDITCDREKHRLYADWKGYQSVESIRQGAERMLEFMVQYKSYDIVNDNTNVLGIWRGASKWLAEDWFPRLRAAGLKRFAWINSPSRLSQVSTDATVEMLDADQFGVRVFHDKLDALAWLNGKTAGKAAGKARMRVLVVEDNRDFSQLFRDMLHIMGCDPEVAGTARSGLEMARKTQPDLVFCDLGLPGDMDGFQFAQALRADTGLASTPLIAVSGYTADADKQRALDAGFNRVFPKPVKFADVSDALATYSKQALLRQTPAI
jgi:CheY-like chemotaxis protein